MVVTMELKHVIKRGEKYYFRMLVPKDCVEAVGKTEITVALRTDDLAVIKASVERFKAFWTERFEKAREPSSPVPAKNSTTPPDEDGEAFRQKLFELREKNLPRLLKAESDKELSDRLGQGSTGGSISPVSTNVTRGSNATFVITANSYNRIATLTTNGASAGVSFDNTSTSYNYTWYNVQAAGTVTVSFVQQVTTNAPAQVPYEWLASYFVTNDYNAAANADQDSDGLKTWQEYIAGTDPTNSASVLKAAQNTRNTITWSPVSGRVYSVYWSTNLVKGFQPLETNIPWTRSSFTNSTTAPQGFYKIDVRME